MLRLHPSAIMLTHDETQRVMEERPRKLKAVAELTPLAHWGYMGTYQDHKSKGKQPASSPPSMLTGHHAIVAALQGLSLGASNPSDDPNEDYPGDSDESLQQGGELDAAVFYPIPAGLTDNFDGEGGSESATASVLMGTTTMLATPGDSGTGRMQRWFSRTPVDEDLTERHTNLNWGLEDYDGGELRYDSEEGSAEGSEDTNFLPGEDDDNNSGIVTRDEEQRVANPVMPTVGDVFRTLAQRQLDGTAEMQDEDDDGANLMMETPQRSGLGSPNSDYGPRSRSPSNWLTDDTVHREFVDDVFAYINGSSGIQSPFARNTGGIDIGRRTSDTFDHPDPIGPNIFALGRVGHHMHRFLAESSRRYMRVHERDAAIEPSHYFEDEDEDEVPPEHLAMLVERKSKMQMEAARRIIR